MTEDEAKMKWCPHVVASHTDPRQAPSQYEREAGVTSPFRHHCIASACMAWRTRRQWLDNAQTEPDWVSYQPYAFQPGPGQERDDGFCGLVGAAA